MSFVIAEKRTIRADFDVMVQTDILDFLVMNGTELTFLKRERLIVNLSLLQILDDCQVASTIIVNSLCFYYIGFFQRKIYVDFIGQLEQVLIQGEMVENRASHLHLHLVLATSESVDIRLGLLKRGCKTRLTYTMTTLGEESRPFMFAIQLIAVHASQLVLHIQTISFQMKNCSIHKLPMKMVCLRCQVNFLYCQACAPLHLHSNSLDLQELAKQAALRQSQYRKKLSEYTSNCQRYRDSLIQSLQIQIRGIFKFERWLSRKGVLGSLQSLTAPLQKLIQNDYSHLLKDQIFQISLWLQNDPGQINLLQSSNELSLKFQSFKQNLGRLVDSLQFKTMCSFAQRKFRLLDSIILTQKQQRSFMQLIAIQDCYLKKIFRASEFQFSSKEFHRICDGLSQTLVLVRDQNQQIYGGFAKPAWNSQCRTIADPQTKSFVYNFSKGIKNTLKYKNRKKAIFGFVDQGPNFIDLGIVDRCLTSPNNWGPGGCNYGEYESFQLKRVLEYQIFKVCY